MTISRKKKPALKTSSSKKASSSPAKKKRPKSPPLPAGEYTCTVDSLVGTKLTLNVNDLTIKDTVKLGLRLKIESSIHPKGTFDGSISDILEPKMARMASERMGAPVYYCLVKVETEHGSLFVAMSGYVPVIRFLYHMRNCLIGKDVQVRVTHSMWENTKRADARFVCNPFSNLDS